MADDGYVTIDLNLERHGRGTRVSINATRKGWYEVLTDAVSEMCGLSDPMQVDVVDDQNNPIKDMTYDELDNFMGGAYVLYNNKMITMAYQPKAIPLAINVARASIIHDAIRDMCSEINENFAQTLKGTDSEKKLTEKFEPKGEITKMVQNIVADHITVDFAQSCSDTVLASKRSVEAVRSEIASALLNSLHASMVNSASDIKRCIDQCVGDSMLRVRQAQPRKLNQYNVYKSISHEACRSMRPDIVYIVRDGKENTQGDVTIYQSDKNIKWKRKPATYGGYHKSDGHHYHDNRERSWAKESMDEHRTVTRIHKESMKFSSHAHGGKGHMEIQASVPTEQLYTLLTGEGDAENMSSDIACRSCGGYKYDMNGHGECDHCRNDSSSSSDDDEDYRYNSRSRGMYKHSESVIRQPACPTEKVFKKLTRGKSDMKCKHGHKKVNSSYSHDHTKKDSGGHDNTSNVRSIPPPLVHVDDMVTGSGKMRPSSRSRIIYDKPGKRDSIRSKSESRKERNRSRSNVNTSRRYINNRENRPESYLVTKNSTAHKKIRSSSTSNAIRSTPNNIDSGDFWGNDENGRKMSLTDIVNLQIKKEKSRHGY